MVCVHHHFITVERIPPCNSFPIHHLLLSYFFSLQYLRHWFTTTIFCFRYFATSIFCLSIFSHFDILRSIFSIRYFATSITLAFDILLPIFCYSIFCSLDIWWFWYFAFRYCHETTNCDLWYSIIVLTCKWSIWYLDVLPVPTYYLVST